MDKKIVVSEVAVSDILKRMNSFIEEGSILLSIVKKSVLSAELEGWNDQNFVRFNEEFEGAEKQIKDGLVHFEEVLIPQLKTTLRSIEDFS